MDLYERCPSHKQPVKLKANMRQHTERLKIKLFIIKGYTVLATLQKTANVTW